ncbi:MAG: tRNA (adenosine(37)-N6)-dimethylallyltransferase MiaA [Clostridiales bacterium]|nr:tRNA (adenosine(37)-N6)-dimethylallyltransferase MiaA [Clostridiales bacterium]
MVQKDSVNNKIIIICGPTASGKSELALSLAKMLNTEIISADSMYIYKDLNIGTAKPTPQEMQGIKHHLIDVVFPCDNFSVSDYRNLALPIINDLLSKGKIPIVCGGTGFYINSILYDFSYGNSEANLEIRDKYMKLAIQNGNEYVYNILKECDIESAKKLHPNDLKRVVRALEIYHSGTKKSDIKDPLVPKFDYKAYSIDFNREILYSRINSRVDIMIQNGLVNEVKELLNNGVTKENQCMQAIGYKEIIDYIEGNCSLEKAIDDIKLNTRHYAKRQITYFKKLNIKMLCPASAEDMAKQIVNEL